MRATMMYGAGDVRVEDVPDPVLQEPTDAVVRVLRACVCGSDLHPYHTMPASEQRAPMGHEFLGVVEELGSEVDGVSKGDVVIAPFMFSDGTCEFCREGLHSSCRRGGVWGTGGVGGGQAEAVRVPHARGTLVTVPAEVDSSLLPSLLSLSDVFPTGYHSAVSAGVQEGKTVTVIGDGAVGLSAVLSARLLGADRVILMGRHEDRTNLGVEFGATDVVPERGEEGIARVRELTGGDGTHAVLEAVGYENAYDMAIGVARPGGAISRVGVPQYTEANVGLDLFMNNVTLTGGVAPARAYIERLLPDVLEGRVEPGKVFDDAVDVEGAPNAYRAMSERRSLKVMVKP